MSPRREINLYKQNGTNGGKPNKTAAAHVSQKHEQYFKNLNSALTWPYPAKQGGWIYIQRERGNSSSHDFTPKKQGQRLANYEAHWEKAPQPALISVMQMHPYMMGPWPKPG